MNAQDAGRELHGATAIVTGATGHIGRAIATALAEAGAMVLVNARTSRDAAAAVVEEIERCGGRAVAHMADVTSPGSVEEMVGAALGAFGRLDILVNNVGPPVMGPVTELSYDEWQRAVSTILGGAFLCTRATVPHLASNGRGAIVNIGASSAHAGTPNRSAFVAAKSGLAGLTGALAVELAPQGITVNCVAPGRIERPGATTTHFRDRPIPMGREGKPEELTAMVRFLCGPGGRYTTGQTIHVNGGWHVTMS